MWSHLKLWIKANKVATCGLVGLLLFPLIIGFIYWLPLPQIIAVDSGELLAYYGTVFAILGSFVGYRIEMRKKEKEKNNKLRPFFIVNVNRIDEENGIFEVNVKHKSKDILSYLYFYDTFISDEVKEEYTFIVTYLNLLEDIDAKDIYINVTMDDEIMDNEGYPKYVQLLCNDIEGNLWDCCYYKVKDFDNIYYYPREVEIV